MAPRRGGDSTSSDGSSGSSSSSSCGVDVNYPCTSELMFIYGNRNTSLYSEAEIYGQLVTASVWAAALFCLLTATCSSRSRGGNRAAQTGLFWLQLGLFFFLAAMAFLVTRYAIILQGANVPIGYRHESSVVTLLQRLGTAAVLGAAHAQIQAYMDMSALGRVLFGLAIVAYTVLGVAYSVLDFIVSADAVTRFKDSWVWPIGDRDFALTMDASMIKALKTSATGTGLLPSYVSSRLWSDPNSTQDGAYFYTRDTQVKLGAAADAVALAIAVGLVLLVIGGGLAGRRKAHNGRRTQLLLVATAGLTLTTLFNVVVDGYYVLWNWGVISDLQQWVSFNGQYPARPDTLSPIVPPPGFLPAYRIAVDGFPVVRAVIEPLGIVLACTAVMVLVRIEAKDRNRQVVYRSSKM